MGSVHRFTNRRLVGTCIIHSDRLHFWVLDFILYITYKLIILIDHSVLLPEADLGKIESHLEFSLSWSMLLHCRLHRHYRTNLNRRSSGKRANLIDNNTKTRLRLLKTLTSHKYLQSCALFLVISLSSISQETLIDV